MNNKIESLDCVIKISIWRKLINWIKRPFNRDIVIGFDKEPNPIFEELKCTDREFSEDVIKDILENTEPFFGENKPIIIFGWEEMKKELKDET